MNFEEDHLLLFTVGVKGYFRDIQGAGLAGLEQFFSSGLVSRKILNGAAGPS